MLGASGWQTLFRITLPISNGAYSTVVLLCNGRAIGEFGCVAVVSGHIVGLTTTSRCTSRCSIMISASPPRLRFASLLTLMAFATLILRALLEWRADWRLAGSGLH